MRIKPSYLRHQNDTPQTHKQTKTKNKPRMDTNAHEWKMQLTADGTEITDKKNECTRMNSNTNYMFLIRVHSCPFVVKTLPLIRTQRPRRPGGCLVFFFVSSRLRG